MNQLKALIVDDEVGSSFEQNINGLKARMKTRIGCLHAHYSNIGYIQEALSSSGLEFIHYVDPGLITRMMSDEHFDIQQAHNKVIDQIEWIAGAGVDAILITCTNYIALLQEDRLKTSVPVIKMDEPFFDHVCSVAEPQSLLFTNPTTVEGTMNRLYDYAAAHDKSIRVDVHVIANTFELIMQGDKERYGNEIAAYILRQHAADKHKPISVAQLSMVESAEAVEREQGVEIGNPLKTLVPYLIAKLT